MEAKNLRIGNKVDLYGQTATIQGADFINQYSESTGYFDSFKPIELNIEWIEKFGFKFTAKLYELLIYRKGKYFISVNTDSGEVIFGIKEEKNTSYIPLYKSLKFYVNKLQNLYYSLNDEEL